MEKLYHECFTKIFDGTNRLIRKGERYLIPINEPFWKYPEDITVNTKTCSEEKEQRQVKKRDHDKYFKEKEKQFIKLDIQRWVDSSLIGSEESKTLLEPNTSKDF